MCPLCHSGNESLAHLQCWCPSLADARIKAHHHVWRTVWAQLTKRGRRDWSFAIEVTAKDLWEQGAPQRHESTRVAWQHSLSHLVDTTPPDDAQDAIDALTQLISDLRTAPQQHALGWQTVIETSDARLKHEMAGILLLIEDGISLDQILAQIHAEMRSLRNNVDEINRKRPDGIAVDWRNKKVFLLEYTRCYDSNKEALQSAEAFKAMRYTPLLTSILSKLGSEWSGRILTFTTGIRGSIDVGTWNTHLTQLDVREKALNLVIQRAVVSTGCPLHGTLSCQK